MTKPSVSDFQGCSWKGFDLSRFVTDWKDTRQPGLAIHRYFGRDGGEVERIARKPHEVKVTLAFAGPSWRRDWLPIAASIDEDPAGPLVHPAYGQMQAVCQGFDSASMNIETASNLYVVPLSFVEDSIDTRLARAERSTASARADVEATGSALLQRTSRQSVAYSSIARLVGVARLVATASRQEAARALGRVRAAAEAARGAARAAESASERYTLLAHIEQLEDACARTAAAAGDGGLILFEVPVLASLAALCASLYPGESLSHMSEILAANADRIPNPAVIRPGTQLLIPRPPSRR